MNSEFTLPVFPKATPSYEMRLIDSLLLQLTIALEEMRAPGTVRCNKINIASIPTSATGLESGDVWSDGGTLKIVS